MTGKSLTNHLLCALMLCATLNTGTAAATEQTAVPLPSWQALEFEERAFWATAHSRIELNPLNNGGERWEFRAKSSIPGNSEQVTLELDARSGEVEKRERLSRGKKDSRFKSYTYSADHVLRERREPKGSASASPDTWPVASRSKLPYPESADKLVITNPYLLILLAERLQQEGPGATAEVLVHTDENFYRATLTCGTGIPLQTDYSLSGKEQVREARETLGVAIKVQPEGSLADADDFSLLGLHGDIILFFDRDSDLPLQVRGEAPRVGTTEINLKSVTMRPAQS